MEVFFRRNTMALLWMGHQIRTGNMAAIPKKLSVKRRRNGTSVASRRRWLTTTSRLYAGLTRSIVQQGWGQSGHGSSVSSAVSDMTETGRNATVKSATCVGGSAEIAGGGRKFRVELNLHHQFRRTWGRSNLVRRVCAICTFRACLRARAGVLPNDRAIAHVSGEMQGPRASRRDRRP